MKAIILHGLKENVGYTGGDENDVTFDKIYQIMNSDAPLEDLFFIDDAGKRHYGAGEDSHYNYTLYDLDEVTSA